MMRYIFGVLLMSGLSVFASQAMADAKAGEAVVKKSDCMLCHAVDKAVVGPAFKDVAAKYKGADKATIAKLAAKVKAGGSGVWGQAAMIPHPQLSDAELQDAVTWVLAQH
jgi:cytochrome c